MAQVMRSQDGPRRRRVALGALLVVGAMLWTGVSASVAVAQGPEVRPDNASAARPAPPTDVRVPTLAFDEQSITLVWHKPANYTSIVDYHVYLNGRLVGKASDDGSSPAQPYIDRFYADPANSQQVRVVKNNYTATGLAPSTTYRFTVRSVDAGGRESRDSNVVVQATTAVPKVFNIVNYGAVGDGTTLNTKAIQAAIDACTPGGKVVVPAGVFTTGALWLKSDMTLEVAEGATLRGSANAADYPYHYRLYDYSTDERFYSLINAHTYDYGSIANIRIVGKGTIDGNGWKQNGVDADGFPLSAKSSQQTVGENGILAKAQVAEGARLGNPSPYITRSNLITLRGVRNVYYGGFTALNPSNHTLVNLHSDNVTVNGVRLETFDVNNADGIEFAHGDGLTVFNTVFDTGDDAMNFAAGLGARSELDEPTQNAWIFNNYFREGHGAVVVGSHTGAWIQNIVAEDNVMYRTDVGLRMKTDPNNGGGGRNVLFRDNAMKDITNEGFIFTSAYSDPLAAIVVEPAKDKAQFYNVVVRNVTVDGTGKEAIKVVGVADQYHHDLHFDNVRFLSAKPTSIQYLKNSSFHDVVFDATSDPWAVRDSTGLSFTGSTTATSVTVDAAQGPVWPRPSRLNATAGETSATLSWPAATDNRAVGRYAVYRNGMLVATVGPDVLGYQVTGLAPALRYRFTVQAVDATGNATDGPAATVVTQGTRDRVPPVAPTGTDAVTADPANVGTTWARLAWQAASDNYGVDHYEVLVDGRSVATVSGQVLSTPVTGLSPQTSYALTVRAVDATGNATTYGQSASVSTKAFPPHDPGRPTT